MKSDSNIIHSNDLITDYIHVHVQYSTCILTQDIIHTPMTY